MEIATWNVRNVFQEMKHVDVIKTNQRVIYYSGNNTKEHRYRVGIILSANLVNAITHFVPLSDASALRWLIKH